MKKISEELCLLITEFLNDKDSIRLLTTIKTNNLIKRYKFKEAYSIEKIKEKKEYKIMAIKDVMNFESINKFRNIREIIFDNKL